MRKKLIGIILCMFLFLPIIQGAPSNLLKKNEAPRDNMRVQENSLVDGGWLEERDGVLILQVSGSNYEMGYQHGYLLKEQVQENVRAFLQYAMSAISYDDLLTMWELAKPYIPNEYIEEVQGIADGANVSFYDIAAAIMAIEWADHGCFGIAAWGSATCDGQLYHARSFDLPSTIHDPVTGIYAHENSILVVRDPTNGSASLCASIAGSFHTGGGINEEGVGIGLQICWSNDQTMKGNPYHFRIQQTLDHVETAEEAITIVNTNRTHGFNLIISNADPPIGYAVEQSANRTYNGTFDDPVESITPFWQIDHVVRRTNCFLGPGLAATQRKRYDPTGLIGFLNLLFYRRTGNFFFAVYQLYSSVSDQIVQREGSLDLNQTMAALQNGYRSEDNFLLRLIERVGRGTGMAEAWNQWTACPATGDMVVSFATRDTYAYENSPHYFNLYELLTHEPPRK